MRIDYSDGSFMLSWEKVRAWFSPDGSLKDAEYKLTGRNYGPTRAVSKRHTKVLAWLAKQGKQEIDLLNRGILKRKV